MGTSVNGPFHENSVPTLEMLSKYEKIFKGKGATEGLILQLEDYAKLILWRNRNRILNSESVTTAAKMTLKPPGPHMEASVRVKAVYDHAAAVSINADTPPRLYLRSGRELIRSAASYQEDGQTERAYILYIRFLTIFLDKLRQHPNYKDISPAEKKVMQSFCNKILPEAEFLKKELLTKYEKDHEEYQVQIERLRKEAEEQKRLEKERAKQGKTNGPQAGMPNKPSSSGSGSIYNDQASTGTFLPSAFGIATAQPGAPVPGSFVYGDTIAGYRNNFDGGVTDLVPSAPPASVGPSVPVPSVDRSTKPKPNRFLNPIETGIRPITVPRDLATTFLRYAEVNTSRNVETCGLLTGKISGNGLIITDLIIPKQTGSSDTCNMSDEAEIFGLQDKYNLISFGWIHTHPSQTAFLSSIDMHTHYSYQVMMPEAIAIVCAPKHNQTGTFTLTPEGMDEIGSCSLQGFHPHSSSGLFTEAPHSTLDPTTKVRVHDLRS